MINKDLQYAYLLQNDFKLFFKIAFSDLTSSPLIESWYIDLICEYLKAFEAGEIRNLNINIPPRFAKSLICSVIFPTYLMAKNPSIKIISVAFNNNLTKTLHNQARALMGRSWLINSFPDFKVLMSNTNEVHTSATGFRYSTSVNAGVTGKGCDIMITDDVMDPNMALSDVQRESTLEWLRTTLFSRFNNPKEGKKLNIQQRLHKEDYTGTFVEDNKEWENLVIPVYANDDIFYSFGNVEKTYKKDEFLCEERFGEEEVKKQKKYMGNEDFSAQYMQQPSVKGGALFKKSYFQYYDNRHIHWKEFNYTRKAIFADTASKKGRHNDYSVFMCFGFYIENGVEKMNLIDVYRKKVEVMELIRDAKIFWAMNRGCSKFAIEDKSSGIQLIQTLRRTTDIPVLALNPGREDKYSRAYGVIPYMVQGRVLFPKYNDNLEDLELELLNFGDVKKGNFKKDQVDVLVYAMQDLIQNNNSMLAGNLI